MLGYWIFVVWLVSLLLATFLGVERGRWAIGLGLGLLCGPLGVIAAGALLPSFEVEARRRYELEKFMQQLRRQEFTRAKERQREVSTMTEIVSALESTMQGQQNPLADGLNNLARALDEIARRDPTRELELRSWIGWLTKQSELTRPPSDQRAA